jgi:hypothetical protein
MSDTIDDGRLQDLEIYCEALESKLGAVERIVLELENGTYGGPNEEYMRGVGHARDSLRRKLRAALAGAKSPEPEPAPFCRRQVYGWA